MLLSSCRLHNSHRPSLVIRHLLLVRPSFCLLEASTVSTSCLDCTAHCGPQPPLETDEACHSFSLFLVCRWCLCKLSPWLPSTFLGTGDALLIHGKSSMNVKNSLKKLSRKNTPSNNQRKKGKEGCSERWVLPTGKDWDSVLGTKMVALGCSSLHPRGLAPSSALTHACAFL